jgi:hypothetical protein
VLQATFREPVDRRRGIQALSRLVDVHPHLGLPPTMETFDRVTLPALREEYANRPYAEGEPLIRIGVSLDGRDAVIACHHGVMDGIGMLSLVEAIGGSPVRSLARGISSRPASRPFLRMALERLWSALTSPPARFASRRADGASPPGDLLEVLPCAASVTTATLVSAARSVVADWNGGSPKRRRPVVFAIGASRRASGVQPAPDRCTAYLRLIDVPDCTPAHARELLADCLPEADFPETRGGGLGPLVTRALASRLGATALISHLGRVDSADLQSLALFPATGGPNAVAIGVAQVGGESMLTVRAKAADFDRASVRDLAARLTLALEKAAQYGS